MNRKISINLALAIAIIAMTVTFSVTMIFSQSIFEETVASVRQKETQYDKIAEIDKNVRDNSYYNITDEVLYDMLATGYMAGIQDENARYYTSAQYLNYLNEQSGTSIGIGIDFFKQTGEYPLVTRIYINSPAYDLGIDKGYSIIKIGETDLRNLSTSSINALLRGTEGSTITITYEDSNNRQYEPITLQRRQYETPTIEWQQNENEVVGYIKIIDFKVETANELSNAIDSMTNSEQGLQGLVIDLRDNTDSNIENMLNTLDVILPAGAMGYSLEKDGTTEVLDISDNANRVEVPVVALVNGNTSGGSELFALAVRDFGIGQVVGETTAGNGHIQCTPVRMSDGSAISYTIGIMLSSLNESFNDVGVTPDVEATLRDDEKEMYYNLIPSMDSQVLRAKEALLMFGNLAETGVQEQTTSEPTQEQQQSEEQQPEQSDTEQSDTEQSEVQE